MKYRSFSPLKRFLSGITFLLIVTGTAVQGAQPEGASDIYAAAGSTVYRIDASTGDYEEMGHSFDQVQDVMKTETGLYALTGDPGDTRLSLRIFTGDYGDYIDHSVTDLVGELGGKFYYLKNTLFSDAKLYVYDPETKDSRQAIDPAVVSVKTDGELFYASLLLTDEEHPEAVCRIGYGPDKETGNWSVLKAPEEGAQYLPEIMEGKDGVYFLLREASREQDDEKASVSLYQLEYAEPHNCTFVSSITIPKDGNIRLAGNTDAAVILEYWDDEAREAYILRLEDRISYKIGDLQTEEEFPPIFSSGEEFYTIYGDSDLYIVDKEANGKEIMTLPAEAKLWAVAGSKAVYSLNGSLFLADAEDIREEQEKNAAQTDPAQAGEHSPKHSEYGQAAEELSKVLLQYLEDTQAPYVFFSKLKEDAFVAKVLKETKDDSTVYADLQLGQEGKKVPVKAEFRKKKEQNGYRIDGSVSLTIEGRQEDMEFELNTAAGNLSLSMDGRSEQLDCSSLQTILGNYLPYLTEKKEKGPKTIDPEALSKFFESRAISSEEGVYSYVELTKEAKSENISVPCTVYRMQISWQEVLNLLLLYIDQIEDIYALIQDARTEFSGYESSYDSDSGLNLRENVESLISDIKKYSPDGIALTFSVADEVLVGVSLSAQVSEDTFAAYSPDGKPVGTMRIGAENTPAGLLIEADLKKGAPMAANVYETIQSLPVTLTITAVNEQGDENKEYVNLSLNEGRTQKDYEEWVNNFSFYSTFQNITLSQTYSPGTPEIPGASYTLLIMPGTSYWGSREYTSISLHETAKQEDAASQEEEGAAFSIRVRTGSKTLADGTIQIN